MKKWPNESTAFVSVLNVEQCHLLHAGVQKTAFDLESFLLVLVLLH